MADTNSTSVPVYILVKLNVASNVPLEVIEELFVMKGLDRNDFSVYTLIDKNLSKYTVFDYPIGMKQEEYMEFISKAQRELDILTHYYSSKSIMDIIKSLN